VKPDERLQEEFEKEFEELVFNITNIDERTKEAFHGHNTISRQEILEALINISGIESDIDKDLRIVCLKILRKAVELEVPKANTPAVEWDPGMWSLYR
jgi:hypothetical protein